MVWWLYQLLVAGGMLATAPALLARRGGHYLPTLRGRLGLEAEHGPARPGSKRPARRPDLAPRGGANGGEEDGPLWIHAVSVGEVGVAATLAAALPAHLPLLVTTVTPTGQERARAAFSRGVFTERRVEVAYLPFDLGFAVRRFYRRHQPAALILVEGDYWPLVLREAKRRGLPVVVVNGRVGEKSGRRLARLRPLARSLFFEPVDRFGMQSEDDRQRLVAGGAPPERVAVTGNLKYETATPEPHPELEAVLERLAAGRPILIAGSTMEGEDEQVLDAFEQLGGGRRALLVLVPRHPERWDRVASLVEDRGHARVRRSALDLASTAGADDQETQGVDVAAGGEVPSKSGSRVDVLLLDSLGELAALYRLAAAAFIGGTLVATGGHNPLEPARFAVPIVVGPSMHNFRQMAENFDQAGAWRRVENAADLAAVWSGWLEDPAAARATGRRAADLLAAHRGASERTLELLQPVLERFAESPSRLI